MSIVVRDSGSGDFERPTPGIRQAVCSNIYGPFQESYEWQGKTITAKKVVIMFELDERIKEGEFAGQRFVISQRFTASLNEKSKLRPFLESWKGKALTAEALEGIDLELLIGAGCQLNLIEKEKRGGGKTIIIGGIFPRTKDQEKMEPELPRDFAPKWIKEILDAQKSPSMSPDHFEDEIPF